jgi:hypothetical protein
MDRLDKLLGSARRCPAGLSFAEFETMMSLAKWAWIANVAAMVWYSPKGHRLPIQPVGRKEKHIK